MKKNIFLLFCSIVLCGCSANYNLEYKNNDFKESLSFSAINSNQFDYYLKSNIITDFNYDPGDIDNSLICDYSNCYKKSINYNNDLINYKLEYKFDKNNINNSTIINSLYRNVNIDEYSINLSDAKNIFNDFEMLDKIIISFSTDKYIKESNEDEKKDGIYYWYINRDNYENKTIEIIFTNNKLDTIKPLSNNEADKIINNIILSVVIIIIISCFIFYVRIKKSNK